MAKDSRGATGDRLPREGEGFLERWSRRKTEVKPPAALPAADAGLAVEGTEPLAGGAGLLGENPEQPAADTEQVDQLPAAAAELPDIDKMDAGSDYSMFMQAGVPQALKTKALRKLWRVKPELANLDGLLDYGEDLTGSFKVVDRLKTAYEVGKGFLRDEEETPKDASPRVDDDADEVSEDPAIAEDEDQTAEVDQTAESGVVPNDVVEDETSANEITKG